MSMSTAKARSNYFRVKDEAQFRAIMRLCTASNDEAGKVEVFTNTEDGETLFAFGTEGSLNGYRVYHLDDGDKVVPPKEQEEYDGYDFDDDFDSFAEDLKNVVADGDAVIIVELFSMKLAEVNASMTVITSSGWSYAQLTDLATDKAREMLGNPSWETKCYY